MLSGMRMLLGSACVAWTLLAGFPLLAQEEAAAVPPAMQPAGTVFKSVGPDGKVIYTDAPAASQQAEAVKMRSTNTIPAATMPLVADRAGGAEGSGYKVFALTAPVPDQMLGYEVDVFTVTAALEPALQEGHLVQFFYDGKALGQPDAYLAYTLNNMERGTHTAEARIVNDKGAFLLSTGVVKFHVKRQILKDKERVGEEATGEEAADKEADDKEATGEETGEETAGDKETADEEATGGETGEEAADAGKDEGTKDEGTGTAGGDESKEIPVLGRDASSARGSRSTGGFGSGSGFGSPGGAGSAGGAGSIGGGLPVSGSSGGTSGGKSSGSSGGAGSAGGAGGIGGGKPATGK